ncbi:MAG: hypothetical protein WD066_10220 [Planctomycetaceae bacterium]
MQLSHRCSRSILFSLLLARGLAAVVCANSQRELTKETRSRGVYPLGGNTVGRKGKLTSLVAVAARPPRG